MNSSDHTSEFSLISSLTNTFPNLHNVHTGIGDDAAVIQTSEDTFQLFTTDALVENDHFSLEWSTPEQIGMKAMEANVSDIAAMGGIPRFFLISLVVTPQTKKSWIQRLYNGIKHACEKYNITLLGGDTTHGSLHMVSISMTGTSTKKTLCLRSDAQAGDIICVSGEVGGSSAGFFSLQKKLPLTPYIRKRHLEPKARLDISRIISSYAHALIDISDGVGSEIRHICSQSKKGATLYESALPVHPEVKSAEQKLKFPPSFCALSGGEDFELLFTISEKNLEILRKKYKSSLFSEISIIGRIEKDQRLSLISESGKTREIPGGYDHLSPPSIP
jgi:thiamine-monophosphate kinase